MKRWYDKHTRLGPQIDRLKDINKLECDWLITGMTKIINSHSPTLLDDFVIEFPLEANRKRWYDTDPYLWLTINGLQYAPLDLQDAVAGYLEKEKENVKE